MKGEPTKPVDCLLIVDRDPLVARLMQRSLCDAATVVLAATSAKAALDILRNRPKAIGILLADITLPEVADRQLDRVALARNPNVISLRTTCFVDWRINTGTLKNAPLLCKPFRPNELREFVAQAIRATGKRHANVDLEQSE